MKELRKKIEEQADLLTGIIEDTVTFGIKFEEAVPAMTSFCYRDENGQCYGMKLELSIIDKL